MVMGKSWNIKKWPKVIEFCDQSLNFVIRHGILPILPPEMYQICIFLSPLKIQAAI